MVITVLDIASVREFPRKTVFFDLIASSNLVDIVIQISTIKHFALCGFGLLPRWNRQQSKYKTVVTNPSRWILHYFGYSIASVTLGTRHERQKFWAYCSVRYHTVLDWHSMYSQLCMSELVLHRYFTSMGVKHPSFWRPMNEQPA